MNEKYDEILKGIVVKNSRARIQVADITVYSNLINDFNYDSMLIVQLIVDIESELGIEFDDDDINIEIFTSYGALRDCIQKKTTAF